MNSALPIDQAVKKSSSDEHEICSQSQAFEDVGTFQDSSVNVHFHFGLQSCNLFPDERKRLNPCRRGI